MADIVVHSSDSIYPCANHQANPLKSLFLEMSVDCCRALQQRVGYYMEVGHKALVT